jgi:hypothetical protein
MVDSNKKSIKVACDNTRNGGEDDVLLSATLRPRLDGA